MNAPSVRSVLSPRVTRKVVFVAGLGVLAYALALCRPSKPVVDVSYVIGTDAADLLVPLLKEFNALNTDTQGQRVHATWSISPSGRAVSDIVKGELKPVVWTPGSALWGGLLNNEWGGQGLVHDFGPVLVQSPQVVAMFEKSAKTLGLGSSEPLARLLDEAAAGDLRFGHTDPFVSTSGLSAVYSEFSLASGATRRGLRPKDVANAGVLEKVRTWERAMAHYVDIGKDFKSLWCRYGHEFADAAYMQETTYLEFTRACRKQLVAIYPADVPLVAEYRYIVLDARWVSSEQRAAARALGQWLVGQLSGNCDAIARNGFRRTGCAPPSVDASEPHGAPPPPPESRALAAAQHAWGELRRPANVMLIVDQTGPMSLPGRLPSAREALGVGEGSQPPFVRCLRDQDHVGMIVFGGDVQSAVEERVPLGLFSDARTRDRLTRSIDELSAARGEPALFDAIEMALDTPGMLSPETINTVVVLSYGDSTGRTTSSIRELIERVRGLRNVQILAVAYRNPAVLRPLTELVEASLGRSYGLDATGASVADISKFLCQSFL